MRLTRWTICLPLLLLVSGCATEAGYEKRLDTWVGKDEVSLVRAWGPPHRAYETAGVKMLAFVSNSEGWMPGSPGRMSDEFVNGKIVPVYIPATPGYSFVRSCETTFELTRGRVTRWSWRGNACKAKDPD